MTETSIHTDNALVLAKNRIIEALNDAETPEAVYAVLCSLRIHAETWASLFYGYKTVELCDRITDIAARHNAELEEARKAPKTRQRWAEVCCEAAEFKRVAQVMHSAAMNN